MSTMLKTILKIAAPALAYVCRLLAFVIGMKTLAISTYKWDRAIWTRYPDQYEPPNPARVVREGALTGPFLATELISVLVLAYWHPWIERRLPKHKLSASSVQLEAQARAPPMSWTNTVIKWSSTVLLSHIMLVAGWAIYSIRAGEATIDDYKSPLPTLMVIVSAYFSPAALASLLVFIYIPAQYRLLATEAGLLLEELVLLGLAEYGVSWLLTTRPGRAIIELIAESDRELAKQEL